MPVPVPRISKPLAHPVIKKNKSGDYQPNPFQNLTLTLPLSPRGPPPSFGTREQWIESLPSWRRKKQRRIWEEDDTTQLKHPAAQDFHQGLAVAVNATVIKGERAQACIPPLYTPLESSQAISPNFPTAMAVSSLETDDEMNFDLPEWPYDAHSYHDDDNAASRHNPSWNDATAPNPSPASINTDISLHDIQPYERGAFSPVFEEESPGTGHEAASSPLEPVTPCGDFGDRAIARAQSSDGHCGISLAVTDPTTYDRMSDFQSVQGKALFEHPKQPVRVCVSETTSSAATTYKKLAEPLSEWIANYVWKVCTTGLSLPSAYVNPTSIPIARFLDSPPRSLAPSIHSILLSTLLQPSAVFLALWYITQLPVYCGAVDVGHEELRFRTALFGEPRTLASTDNAVLNLTPLEDSMPFRLVVLGCMLANKWLDDHTFSNKTWHSISNIPIHMLNQLEVLALDIFSYNLSIPSDKWKFWMDRVLTHHLSSIPPSHAQPISRPSSNPHLIIRKTIEDILKMSDPTRISTPPQPTFIGLEERVREKSEKESTVDDIDLDEDGPLREEYLPRRSSRFNSYNSHERNDSSGHSLRQSVPEKALPPPAKWSPAGDEPIFRDKNRTSGNYVPVQATEATIFPVYSSLYSQASDTNYQAQIWGASGGFVALKPTMNYGFDVSVRHQPLYNAYSYPAPVPVVHLRSHSLSYEQDNVQMRGHMRSYSQGGFDYGGDTHMTAAPDVASFKESQQWYPTNHYSYVPSTYGYHPGVMHQPSWIRT
ncbi:hypothetical protein AMATHDRAFT_74109 [Amanita thiersii Skay4041]|uniref:Cyclin N-terminal domain-containing protein n=1 Tax=Amanita thiersii Skay4041 TaxID=703135 RepID=A0A2A9NXQ4_9AGAR|nr:hypothetical protein AMATHDRAFT_74109 [Amanita thiersii Skay4041]